MSFAKLSSGASADPNSFYSTTTSRSYGSGAMPREPVAPSSTGYSNNIRPIVGYSAKYDDPVFAKECGPENHYQRTTGLTYRAPDAVRNARHIADPTTRQPMATGYAKEVPVTLPRASEISRDYRTQTGVVFTQQPYLPQKAEPRRGNQGELETWRMDMEKAAGSVWNKERHGRDFITHQQMFDPSGKSRGGIGGSETTARYEAPKMVPSVTNGMPNLVEARAPFDRSGVGAPAGPNAFAKSTKVRPAYLTDPPTLEENRAIEPKGHAGSMILTRMQRQDPCEFVNNVADPGATTSALHPYQPTTRELEAADRIAARRVPGNKMASGALSNTRPTALYAPEAQAPEWLKSTYARTIAAPANHNTARSGSLANVTPVKDNAFVRGTFVHPFGAQDERAALEAQDAQVARKALQADPFVVDTKHAHKMRA